MRKDGVLTHLHSILSCTAYTVEKFVMLIPVKNTQIVGENRIFFTTCEYYSSKTNKIVEWYKPLETLCQERNDKMSRDILMRLSGMRSDLPASDARYHKDCKGIFHLSKYEKVTCFEVDEAFSNVIKEMIDKPMIWNSVELHKMYKDFDGSKCSRKTLIESLVCHFKDRLLTFHVNGYAKLLCFNDNAMIGLELVKETAVNEVEIALQTCANIIKEECKMADISSTEYRTSIDQTIAREVVSETVLRLLETISPRFTDSLSAILIGNIITSVVKQQCTPLQIALAVLFRSSKADVSRLHDYLVTASYDKLLRFKKSAAFHSAKNLLPSIPTGNSLAQVIVDNFDSEIHSKNMLCPCNNCYQKWDTLTRRKDSKTPEERYV